ncbi:MAG TPA: hypothetical protein VFQ92_02440 [Blastocatellia bacterium]|nr:hypothetical protein [Blastocatellia bacterium]
MILLLAVSLAIGCEQTPQVPGVAKQNYPAIIRDSPDRRANAEREWRRMLDAYGVAQTPPDLYPIIYTPRSLLGVSGAIDVMPYTPEPGNEDIALRTAVRGFIDRWREFIGADPAALSLVSADETGPTRRLLYQQANYPFPIASGFGEMTVIISSDGKLMQLDDRLIPVVELPLQPAIAREDAARRVVGRTFTYADIAGARQQERIDAIEAVSVKRIVALPVEKADAIEVHLAWEITAGKALTWTVYIDAMTGEDLRVDQNFNT